MVIIALDIGLKRIGVAKYIQNIPLCLEPILRKNRNQAAQDVRNLVVESKASIVVVGIPYGESEEVLAMQQRIRHFVGLLKLPQTIKIVFLDESFSSFEALERLEDKKARKKANLKIGSLDSLAALVILERFLMRQKQD